MSNNHLVAANKNPADWQPTDPPQKEKVAALLNLLPKRGKSAVLDRLVFRIGNGRWGLLDQMDKLRLVCCAESDIIWIILSAVWALIHRRDVGGRLTAPVSEPANLIVSMTSRRLRRGSLHLAG